MTTLIKTKLFKACDSPPIHNALLLRDSSGEEWWIASLIIHHTKRLAMENLDDHHKRVNKLKPTGFWRDFRVC